jgi:hypothetical protein
LRSIPGTDHPVIVKAERFIFSGRFFTLVPMVKPTDSRQIDYLALTGWPELYRPTVLRAFFKAQVRPVFMIILEIRTKNSSQASYVQDDDMACTLSPDRAFHSLDKWILPGTLRGRDHLFDAHAVHSIAEEDAIDPVPVPQQILWRRIPGESLHDLLGYLLPTQI